jgi:hypothetical protein
VATDNPTPLVTPAEMVEGPFADLVRGYSTQALTNLLVDATRGCESEVQRQLTPFTKTETHRAEGIDPDEFTGGSPFPPGLPGGLSRSSTAAFGVESMVRHVWLSEYPPIFPALWTYSGVQVTLLRSGGGTEVLPGGQVTGPEHDGHVWFTPGTFLPTGSLIRITYSGGYGTVPGDLRRACKYLAASIAVRELDPQARTGHSADDLEARAVAWLSPYGREA